MSVYSKPAYRLKERLQENNEKKIIIFRAREKKTIKNIAVKTYYKIKNINCSSIVKVIGAAEDKNSFYMEMEYCSSGDLSIVYGPIEGVIFQKNL